MVIKMHAIEPREIQYISPSPYEHHLRQKSWN